MTLRINSNAEALGGFRQVTRNSQMLSQSLQRLSSGLRINRASDDSAGLVISEQMRAQISGLTQAIRNSETAVNMVQTAEGSLDEISTLLKKVRSLALHAANAAPNDVSQRVADQNEMDNAVASISRIAQTTQFGTKKLIDGTLAAANSYDTTKVFAFDIGSTLMTRVDFTPGQISLVIDSSAESKTYMKTAGAYTTVSGASLAGAISNTGLGSPTLTLASIMNNISASSPIGSMTSTITFENAMGINNFNGSGSFGGFFANGANIVGGGSIAANTATSVALSMNIANTSIYGSITIRLGETNFGFTDGTSVNTILASLNAGQSKYSVVADTSGNGGLVMYTKETGNIAAARDFSVVAFWSVNVLVSGQEAGAAISHASFAMAGSTTFTNTATANMSYGHNVATTIKLSGADTVTGIQLGASVNDTTAGVFVGSDGLSVANTLRGALGNATNALKANAALSVTVAGKEFQFSNRESMGDMVSYINTKQDEYTVYVDRDHGLAAVRSKLGAGGLIGDLTVRVTDVLGTTATLTALAASSVGFEGSGGTPATAGIDVGVNLLAHLSGAGLPGGAVNLNTSPDDASILTNSAYGIRITTNADFLRHANDTVNNTIDGVTASVTRGALFQVGPNNSQAVAVDIKDVQANRLGLGGDATNTLRSLQDVASKQSLINGYYTQTLQVIDKAIDDVTVLRGALGAFQSNALETGLNSLRTTHENLTSAESTIRDTDFAEESSLFAKNQILVQASTAMLAQANQLPQAVLQLIQQ